MTRVWSLSPDRRFYLSNGAAPRPTNAAPPPPPPPNKTGRLTRVRGASVFTTAPPPPPPPPSGGAFYAAGTEPWRLASGATIYDGMPTAGTLVYAHDYTSSRDLVTVLTAIEKITSPAGPVYVQLDSGKYYINTLRNYGTASSPNYIGYANSNRKIMGCVGAGFDPVTGEFLTQVVTAPTMVSSSPDNCRAYVLAKTTSSPVAISTLYFSGNNAAAPVFISGISFDGTLQTPYGVYTGVSFARNAGVSAPLAWKGLSVWRSQVGARFQYSRLRGFAFALNSAPPFECGSIDTNYTNMTSYGIELDGRVAAEFDPARPRAAGGFMWNKELAATLNNSWVHHTRRSGMATNTNTGSTTESYAFNKFQATNIADITASDPWPSDAGALPGGFNSWNIEEVLGTFTVTNGYANSEHSHVNWAVPGNWTLPNRVVIKVKGFESADTLYNGCLRIATPQTPNSLGTSPIWSALNSNFASACATYFDIRRADNTPLTPVKASQFNGGTMGPNTHYVLRTF